jgi:hypothetical protein
MGSYLSKYSVVLGAKGAKQNAGPPLSKRARYILYILLPRIFYNFDMLRELQALAKFASNDDTRQPSERATKLLAGASQGLRGMHPVELVGLGLLPVMPAIRASVNSSKGFDPELIPQTPDELDKLVIRLREGQKIPEPTLVGLVSQPGKSNYRRTYPWRRYQERQIQVAPKSNPLTIAHELGHAIQPNKFEDVLNLLALLNQKPLALALPSIVALSGGLSKDEETPLWAKAAPVLGGAQLATILGEETRANIRALKLLKEHKIPLTAFQKLRQFVPSLSYLGRAALLVGAPLGILQGHKLYEESRKKGQPMTFEQVSKTSPGTINKTLTPKEFEEKWGPRLNKKET